jgi:hypothetical protein
VSPRFAGCMCRPIGASAGLARGAWAWRADTTTAHGRLMLSVLGGLAEFERELIRTRTGEGRERAKARGVTLPLSLPLCYHSAMTKSTYDNIAKPVRKRSAKTGTLVGVRLQSEQIKAIDVWAAKQVPPVTRPEAIRGMIDAMLHILAKDPGEQPAKKARTR